MLFPRWFAILVGFGLIASSWGTVMAEPQPTESTQSFDKAALDEGVESCKDFYQYACGTWIKTHPIPADESSWSAFDVLADRNREALHQILEKAAASPTPATRKIGDYYASCMNESAIEAAGVAPMNDALGRIAAVKNRSQLPALLAYLHTLGVPALFRFSSKQDFKDASQVIAVADQGGLGLPNRDYYLKTDAKSVEIRAAYLAHIANMFRLLGENDSAEENAKAVLALETTLAEGSLDPVQRRDPTRLYHPTSTAALRRMTPAFSWNTYLANVPTPKLVRLNVAVPSFFQKVNDVVARRDLSEIKTYLRWQLLKSSAPVLPKAFVSENFSFFEQTLTGAKELKVRWKRCVESTDSNLGEDLGKVYVAQYFPSTSRTRMIKLVATLEKTLRADIQSLEWMSAATKKQALIKLNAIVDKIGYPSRWRDYSRLRIVREDALGNLQRSKAFEFRRRLSKIGQPVDRNEWLMTPPTVNAYYLEQTNEINFPAGILQPPFFDAQADDAVNYGAIGSVIGHELTHGFDDEGRKFDATGNLRDWWTPADTKAFNQRASCLVDQYSGYTFVDDVKLNGKLTLGENTADNGGVRIAYAALIQLLALNKDKQIDGFTPAQRFFISYAQVWCENLTPEISRLYAQTDPHAKGEFRVNGVVSNMPEFQKAFSCPAKAAMVRQNACRVW
jgi:putative endopeptidase